MFGFDNEIATDVNYSTDCLYDSIRPEVVVVVSILINDDPQVAQ